MVAHFVRSTISKIQDILSKNAVAKNSYENYYFLRLSENR